MKTPWKNLKKNNRAQSVRRNLFIILITLIEMYLVLDFGFSMLIRENSKILYNLILESDKTFIQLAVNNTIQKIDDTRTFLEKKGSSDEEIRTELYNVLYDRVHTEDFPGGGYMWVNEILDYSGGDDYAIRLMHPNPTSSEGMKLSTKTKDAAGDTPYQTELDLINRSGSGFYTYYYQPDADTKPVRKITYCALDREDNWVICASMNLNSIEKYENLQKEKLLPFISWILILLTIICMSVTVLTTGFYSRQYNKRLLQKNKELDDLAYRDALTGLYNRGGMNRTLDQLVNDKQVRGLTGIFIDLDDFKLINDIYGHTAGDLALQNLADYLRQSFPGAVIGRTGGDEFCVIIAGQSPQACEKLFQKVMPGERTFCFVGQTIHYTLSGGYADYPSQAKYSAELMEMMDSALYAAKINGKSTIRHYSPDMADLKRAQLGFNVKNMASGMPGGFLIYKASAEEEILFANDHLIDLFECDTYEDFLEFTQSSFRHVVYSEDLERVEKSIRDQIRHGMEHFSSSKKNYEDFVEYRILTKTGKIRNVIDLGRMVTDQHYGDIFYVFIMDRERLSKELWSEEKEQQF